MDLNDWWSTCNTKGQLFHVNHAVIFSLLHFVAVCMSVGLSISRRPETILGGPGADRGTEGKLGQEDKQRRRGRGWGEKGPPPLRRCFFSRPSFPSAPQSAPRSLKPSFGLPAFLQINWFVHFHGYLQLDLAARPALWSCELTPLGGLRATWGRLDGDLKNPHSTALAQPLSTGSEMNYYPKSPAGDQWTTLRCQLIEGKRMALV